MRLLLRRAIPLFALLLAGCSADRDVLVRVGNRTVTVDEFESVARGNESQYPGTPDQAKAALLEDLLRRSLLLHEAEQRGMFRDSGVTILRRAAEERLLTEALYQSLAPARVAVSDAEVARAVAWRDTAAHLLLIYGPSRAMAQAAAAELAHGADFAVVADKFNPPGLLPPGGDFGFVRPGTLVPVVDGLLRTAPLGENVGPFESPGEGWFVIRIVEREYRPMDSPGTESATTREQLRQRKRRVASIRSYAALKEEYGFHVAPDAGTTLYARIQATDDPLNGMGTPRVPEPDSGDEDRVLAYWDDGRATQVYRLSEALVDLEQEPRRPDATRTVALERWIEQRAMRHVALTEARRRGFAQEPEIRRRLDASVENQVLEAIYEQDVAAEARLFPLDVPAYYQSIRGAFQKLDEVTLESVTLADSGQAQEVMRHAGQSPNLAAALQMAGASAPIRNEVVRYPNEDPVWHAMSSAFMSIPPGQSVGPAPTPRGWQISRLLAKKQRPAEWNELEPMLRQAVEQQAEEQRRDAALRKVTEHLKRLYKPEVHAERLARIPWPVTPAGPPS